jgi:thiamine-phosphate pyrophosphorylase
MILQYRHKEEWSQKEFDEADAVAALCRAACATFVLNDRSDFAKLLQAALHIGQDDLPVKAARLVVGEPAVVGKSTHNKLQVTWADEEAIDYLALGPIFETGSKLKPDPVLGVEKLKSMRSLSRKPVVAIGGITLDNARSVLRAGADSVAVISGYLPEKCSRSKVADLTRSWLKATS